MKTKLILSTEKKDTELWKDFPFIPRQDEWINLEELLKAEELEIIKQSAQCWSGKRGTVQSVEYRFNGSEYFTEIFVWCED